MMEGVRSRSDGSGGLERIRDEITAGTSFTLTSEAVRDRVQEAFAGQRAKLLFTILPKEQEDTSRPPSSSRRSQPP